MGNIRTVFYHTTTILKGNFWKSFLLLFFGSLAIMLYTESLQLVLNMQSMTYYVGTLICTFFNMIVMDFILFMFVKRVRKEQYHLDDLIHIIKQSWKIAVVGFTISIFQLCLIFVFSMLFGKIGWLYLLVYGFIYVLFTVWNLFVAYGIYDGASILDCLTGSLNIMRDHVFSLSAACLGLWVWFMIGQIAIPHLTEAILGKGIFAGMIISGTIYASSISVAAIVKFLLLNLVYYSINYLCLMPIYTYGAKLYDEDYRNVMPSGLRFVEEEEE